MANTVFIIEDDESIRRLLEITLTTSGYIAKSFDNAEDAVSALETETCQLAIFDIMLPGISGLEAVKILRQKEKTQTMPVIMLTAKDTELDKILGLDNGADDYITKPFSVLELTARIRSALRRNQPQTQNETIQIQNIILDKDKHLVTCDNNPVALTNKEFKLLYILLKNKEKAITREDLLEKVWGYDFLGETRTLDIHIGTLRSKLEKAGADAGLITTVRGIGYRINE